MCCVVGNLGLMFIDIEQTLFNKLKRMTRDKTDCLIQVDLALSMYSPTLFGSISSSENVKFENI